MDERPGGVCGGAPLTTRNVRRQHSLEGWRAPKGGSVITHPVDVCFLFFVQFHQLGCSLVDPPPALYFPSSFRPPPAPSPPHSPPANNPRSSTLKLPTASSNTLTASAPSASPSSPAFLSGKLTDRVRSACLDGIRHRARRMRTVSASSGPLLNLEMTWWPVRVAGPRMEEGEAEVGVGRVVEMMEEERAVLSWAREE